MSDKTEWKACRKRPVIVHVREQRDGELHVSTREGITPLRPDDLIMRGVQGEEYPIGRELFEQTYDLVDDAAPEPPAQEETRRVAQLALYSDGGMVALGTDAQLRMLVRFGMETLDDEAMPPAQEAQHPDAAPHPHPPSSYWRR